MAVTYNKNRTVSATPVSLSCEALQFDTDWDTVSDDESKLQLVNNTTPVDKQCRILWQYKSIPNVLKNFPTTVPNPPATRAGAAVSCLFTAVVTATDDSTDPSTIVDLPFKTAVTVTMPTGYFSADEALAHMKAAFDGMFNTDGVTSARLKALFTQAMAPK